MILALQIFASTYEFLNKLVVKDAVLFDFLKKIPNCEYLEPVAEESRQPVTKGIITSQIVSLRGTDVKYRPTDMPLIGRGESDIDR